MLSRGVTSKDCSNFYFLSCIYSIATEDKHEFHKTVCGNKDFCNIVMLSKDNKNLEFNNYQISDKTPFIICADLEYLIEKIDGCTNNTEISSTTKVSEHILSAFSVSTILSFRSRK